MAAGHGDADYLLFVDRKAVGVVEAKKAGSTLTGVEWQSAKYTAGLPENVPALTKPLAFAYESTGVETRFTNAFDPEPASRQVFTFHRPETLAEWVRAWSEWGGVERATFRQRLRGLPPLDPAGLWPAQDAAISNLEVSLTHFPPRALIPMATGSGKTFTRPTSPTASSSTRMPAGSCSSLTGPTLAARCSRSSRRSRRRTTDGSSPSCTTSSTCSRSASTSRHGS